MGMGCFSLSKLETTLVVQFLVLSNGFSYYTYSEIVVHRNNIRFPKIYFPF